MSKIDFKEERIPRWQKIVEIWKDIKGFEGLYQISNFGNVKSLARKVNNGKGIYTRQERVMTGEIDKYGYHQVCLRINGKGKKYKVHRLVAEAFIPNPNNLPEINHKDENKLNNNVDNLEWCTPKYNINYGTARQRMVETMPKRTVLQYSLDGEFIAEHESINAAARAINGRTGNIYNCCVGQYTKTQGYVFEFKD